MNLNELFRGIVAIVDDEIDKRSIDAEEPINILARDLEEHNIPVLPYTSIPSEEDIPALAGTSMIVLDWKLDSIVDDEFSEERITSPAVLSEANTEKLLAFIQNVLDHLFVPVFILSMESKHYIESILDDRFSNKNLRKRIFVLEKTKCQTYESLIECISRWLEDMPSVYACKEWEKLSLKIKNTMFNELYSYSPSWPSIMWKTIMEDVGDEEIAQDEFGSFLTRSFSNRMGGYSFDKDSLQSQQNSDPEELRKVMQGERFISYKENNIPKVLCTGDLFRFGEREKTEYWLNITAQCSTIRDEIPRTMYFIKGEKCDDPVQIHLEQNGVFKGDEQLFSFFQLCHKKRREELNAQLEKIHNEHVINKGAIIGNNSKAYVACVDEQSILCFRLTEIYALREPQNECLQKLIELDDEFVKGLSEKEQSIAEKLKREITSKRKARWKDYCEGLFSKRVGRLLPPYITKIQKAAAAFMIRDGEMRLPIELFK